MAPAIVEWQEVAASSAFAIVAAAVFYITSYRRLGGPDWMQATAHTREKVVVVFYVAPLAFAGLVYWVVYDEKVASGFYEASAQVIPVLILALLVDQRIFKARAIGGKTVAFYLLLLLVVGEGAALYALGQPSRRSDVTAVAVITMLLLATLLLFIAALEHASGASDKE